jgi:hypothetical protein
MKIEISTNPTTPELPQGWKITRFFVDTQYFDYRVSGENMESFESNLGQKLSDLFVWVQVERPDNSVNEAKWDEESKSWNWTNPWSHYEAA